MVFGMKTYFMYFFFLTCKKEIPYKKGTFQQRVSHNNLWEVMLLQDEIDVILYNSG